MHMNKHANAFYICLSTSLSTVIDNITEHCNTNSSENGHSPSVYTHASPVFISYGSELQLKTTSGSENGHPRHMSGLSSCYGCS